MFCPKCGYSLSAFDTECPRCHGKGLGKPTVPLPAPSAVPVQPPVTQPAPVVLPGGNFAPPVAPPAAYPAAPPGRFDGSTLPQADYLFIGSAVTFCLGYLAPWVTVSFFGVSLHSGGQMSLEFIFFLAAVAAAILPVFARSSQAGSIPPQLSPSLSVACLAFGAGKFLYLAIALSFSSLGIGLVLMVVGAGAMSYFSLQRVEAGTRGALVCIAVPLLILVLAWAGYKGNDVRRTAVDPFGLGGTFPPGLSPLTPNPFDVPSAGSRARSDVAVQLNSSRTVTALTPSETFVPPVPLAAGKTFLICTVTVTFNGTTGTLPVASNEFFMTGTNKHIYDSVPMYGGYRDVNLIQANLAPGGVATGEVVFEVDAGAEAEKVEFTTSFFSPPL